MKVIAIIPARGGSKRIERKNIKPFAGQPIIAYSIRAALQSGCFDEVMVSTDDEEIAEVARKYGASVPFMRSAATSDDYATTADVIREVLDQYRLRGKEFDALACIYATAPFVTPQRLAEGFKILTDGRAAAAFTCVEYSYPIQRCLVIGDSGKICMKFPQYAIARSQDLQKTYHDAGQFYFTTVKAFEDCGSLWGPDTLPIVLPETEVQDLDTPTDWILAEMKYELGGFQKEIKLGNYRLVSYTEENDDNLKKILAGRNLPEVRCRMINQDEISEEAHFEFVKNLKFRRDKAYYAVYFSDNGGSGTESLIGSVTLDRLDDRTLERGIWLYPSVQGQGHATRLLTELYKYLYTEKGIAKIITRVFADNKASMSLESALKADKIEDLSKNADPNINVFECNLEFFYKK